MEQNKYINRIVHNKKAKYDVYIGRANGDLPESKWANKYVIGKHGNRKEVIEKYITDLEKNYELMSQLHELDDKILGCWCDYPCEDCHGRALLDLRDKQKKTFSLSASKITTWETCSFQYYGKYKLKLPDDTNDGALRGTTCHLVFEVLFNRKREPLYHKIIKEKTILNTPSIIRLVKKTMKKLQLGEMDNKGQDNLKMIDEMILVGLNTDFYYQNKTIGGSEQRIEIYNKFYYLVGLIDKQATDPHKLYIGDYKSSSKKSDNTIQAMAYALWSKRVKKADAVCEFIYLRFPNRPVVKYEFSDESLSGFEEYLANLYPLLRDLDFKGAISNLAADKPYSTKNDFSGPLVCGRAKKAGDLKKDGSPMYYCNFKFKFDYYVIKNDKGAVIKSSMKKDIIPNIQNGETLETMSYNGCPAFNSTRVVDSDL